MSTSPVIRIAKGGCLSLALVALLGQAALAADVYYSRRVSSVTFTEGALPTVATPGKIEWQVFPAFQPYAVLDGEGEVYIGGENLAPWGPPQEYYLSLIHI